MIIKKEYNDYSIEFVLRPKIAECFDKHNINTNKLFSDTWYWFETILFELTDDDRDGIPDDVYGKKFQIVFYKTEHDYPYDEQKECKINPEIMSNKIIEDSIILELNPNFRTKFIVLKK